MADETLSWRMSVEDRMSAALGLMGSKVDALEKAMGSLQTTTAKTDKALATTAAKAEKALGDTKSKLAGARADFGKAWSELFDLGSSLGKSAMASKMGQRVTSLITAMTGRLSGLGDKISGPLGKVFEGASGFASKLGAPLGRAFDAVMGSSIVTRARGLVSTVGGFVSGVGAKLAPVFAPLASGFGKLFSAAGDFGGALGSKVLPALSSLGSIAGGAVLGITAIGTAMAAASLSLAAAAGKWALSGLSFKENTLTTFKTLLGTQDASERMFSWATKFAATTPFSTQEVVENVRHLLVGGFKESEIDTLMKAVGDIGSNMGNEKMKQLVEVLGQIKAKGKLQGDDLIQLTNAGIGIDPLKNTLGTQLGGKSRAQIDAMFQNGQIKSADAIKAVLETIRTTQSGGTLGGAMEAKGKTLEGLWSSFADIPSTLLFKFDSKGVMKPLKDLLSGIISMFDEGKPLFNKGLAMFQRVGDAWGKALQAIGGVDSEKLIGGMIDAIGNFMSTLAPFAAGFFPELMNQVSQLFTMFGSGNPDGMRQFGKELAEVMGAVATATIVLTSALGGLVMMINEALKWLGDKLGNLGTFIFGDGSMNDADLAKAAADGRAAYLKNHPEIALGGPPPSAMVDGFAPGGAGAQLAPSYNNVGNVAQVNVIVQPGDEKAGVQVAGQVRDSLPATVGGWAMEHGG